MKFWIITNEYLPQKGGLVSYTRNLALEIKKGGNEVEIIVSNSKNKELKESEIVEGIKVHRVNYANVPVFLLPFGPMVYYFRIKKYLRKLDINNNDIVISRFYTFALAMTKVKNVKKHIFITPLVAEKLQRLQAIKSKGIRKIYYYFTLPQIKYLDTSAIKTTPYIGVLSESKKKEIEKEYKIKNKKIAVIEPGIDINRFNIPTLSEKKKLRLEKGFNIEEKVLLCVCRLSTEKNLEILIESMQLIKDDKIKLYIIGDGALKQDLEQLIEKLKLNEKVKLLGAKENIEEYYKIADVFILPSKYEGFGHVYIEALASGLICIAAKSNPPKCVTASEEIIKDDKIGELIEYDDKNDICKKIEKCFQKSTDYKEYRRKYVLNKYTWKKHYINILRSFESND